MSAMAKWRLLVIVAVLACAVPGAATAQGFKWWLSDRFKAELALTPDQATRLDAVFQDLAPRMTADKEELDRLEKSLSDVIREGVASETHVMKLVDGVEAARSSLGKTRTLMMYRMHRILTPEQRDKMKVLHDKWQEDRRQGRRRH